MSDTFGEYSWAVRTYECGPDGAATMASVCNWLQEAASLNAEALAFSKSNFESAGENISWVLTRLKVKMSRFPKWGETVSILTFPRGGRRIVAWRDFVLTGANGEELVCRKLWPVVCRLKQGRTGTSPRRKSAAPENLG